MLLVNNLIENAISYASESSLRISLSESRLVFENNVCGDIISSENELLEPNVKQDNSQGLGQGLYLVDRIANRLGWKLSINVQNQLYQLIILLG